MASAILTQELLKSQLHYNPDTGIFTRLASNHHSIKVGDIAGNLHNTGYHRIRVFNKSYASHRLAWLYMYGEFPKAQLDHINGVRYDNRISNLRQATNSENQQNRKLNSNNVSGFTGVKFHKKTKKWTASIQVNGFRKYLSYYNTPELANEAYLLAKSQIHLFNPVVRES